MDIQFGIGGFGVELLACSDGLVLPNGVDPPLKVVDDPVFAEAPNRVVEDAPEGFVPVLVDRVVGGLPNKLVPPLPAANTFAPDRAVPPPVVFPNNPVGMAPIVVFPANKSPEELAEA